METNVSQDEQDLVGLMAYFYLQNGRPEKAETLLTALDIMVPDQPWTLSTLALAQIRADHADLGLETLDRMAMQGSIDAHFHLMRVQALTALNRNEEADQALNSYLALRKAVPQQADDEPNPARPGN